MNPLRFSGVYEITRYVDTAGTPVTEDIRDRVAQQLVGWGGSAGPKGSTSWAGFRQGHRLIHIVDDEAGKDGTAFQEKEAKLQPWQPNKISPLWNAPVIRPVLQNLSRLRQVLVSPFQKQLEKAYAAKAEKAEAIITEKTVNGYPSFNYQIKPL